MIFLLKFAFTGYHIGITSIRNLFREGIYER